MKDKHARWFMIGLVWLGALGVTWIAGTQLVPPESRNDCYWLTMGMLSFAATLAALYAVWMSNRGGDRTMPLGLAGGVMAGLYLGTVLLWTLVAVAGASFGWLMVLHSLSLFGFAAGLAATSMAGRHAASQDIREKRQEAPLCAFRERYADFLEGLEEHAERAGNDVLREARRLRDEVLDYASSDSVPGLEKEDAAIAGQLNQLESLWADLQTRDAPVGEATATLVRDLQKLERVVRLRDERMARAR